MWVERTQILQWHWMSCKRKEIIWTSLTCYSNYIILAISKFLWPHIYGILSTGRIMNVLFFLINIPKRRAIIWFLLYQLSSIGQTTAKLQAAAKYIENEKGDTQQNETDQDSQDLPISVLGFLWGFLPTSECKIYEDREEGSFCCFHTRFGSGVLVIFSIITLNTLQAIKGLWSCIFGKCWPEIIIYKFKSRYFLLNWFSHMHTEEECLILLFVSAPDLWLLNYWDRVNKLIYFLKVSQLILFFLFIFFSFKIFLCLKHRDKNIYLICSLKQCIMIIYITHSFLANFPGLSATQLLSNFLCWWNSLSHLQASK